MLSYKIFIDLYIINKTYVGKKRRIKRVYSSESKSFVKAWVQSHRAQFRNLPQTGVTDITGTSQIYGMSTNRIAGPAGSINEGIIVGSGTTPVTISDYNLETRIEHGSGPGQLNYNAVTFDSFELIGSTARTVIRRQFENKSGSTVTVKEAGIYMLDGNNHYFCMVRDVFAVAQDVLPSEILEVRYTFQVTV